MNLRTTFLLSLLLIGRVFAGPEQKVIDGVSYQVVRAAAADVRIVWKDDAGKQLLTFPAAASYLTGKQFAADTLMNGGIFESGHVPSGLLVQDGKTLRPVNRNQGKGNFYLMPNGIFLIDSKGAAVIKTEEYPLKDTDVTYAVQSGPLLLRHDQFHPQISATGPSRLHRNGVGIAKDGSIVLLITDFNSPKFPNLYEFAQAFRTLGCRDALFLDGDISQMKSGAAITQPSNPFASIIAVRK